MWRKPSCVDHISAVGYDSDLAAQTRSGHATAYLQRGLDGSRQGGGSQGHRDKLTSSLFSLEGKGAGSLIATILTSLAPPVTPLELSLCLQFG